MNNKFKQKKHSAFTTINGINKEMKVYEQWLMDIPEAECEILFQHDGKNYEGCICLHSRFVCLYSRLSSHTMYNTKENGK